MAPDYTQDNRTGILRTGLGKDVLALRRLAGNEGFNELFDFKIDAMSGQANVDFDKILGTVCQAKIHTLYSDEIRYFDGILTEAEWLSSDHDGHQYRLTLRPWYWLAGQNRKSRIFHNMSVKEILSAVFQEFKSTGSSFFRSDLTESYPTLEYTVQYRESDLNFTRRLMEQFAISFHFEHSKDGHVLVLTDNSEDFKDVSGGKRPYRPVDGQHRAGEEHFSHWAAHRLVTGGKVKLRDYNFETSSVELNAEKEKKGKFTNNDQEFYDYPAKFGKPNDGTFLARRRTEMLRAPDEHFSATGDCLSLAPGMLVRLSEHTISDIKDQTFLCIRAIHNFTAGAYTSGGHGGDDSSYLAHHEFIKKGAPFAPQLRTGRALVPGPQSAIVVGTGEIDCDEHGRILVLFHWDTEGQNSMRCRVAQSWASKKWGSIFTPRVGMEVVVEFLEGDPDCPLVTGAVYNDKNKPPFDLPEEKNISGIKSNSTVGGGGFNQFTFDDTAGKELVELHAQYDLQSKVLNDERRDVDANRTTTIGSDDTITVKQNLTETVNNDRKTKIDSNDTLDVGQKIKVTAGQEITFQVGSSKIVMNSTSITMQAMEIDIKATTALKTQGGINADHKAGGVMNIQSALIKIN